MTALEAAHRFDAPAPLKQHGHVVFRRLEPSSPECCNRFEQSLVTPNRLGAAKANRRVETRSSIHVNCRQAGTLHLLGIRMCPVVTSPLARLPMIAWWARLRRLFRRISITRVARRQPRVRPNRHEEPIFCLKAYFGGLVGLEGDSHPEGQSAEESRKPFWLKSDS